MIKFPFLHAFTGVLQKPVIFLVTYFLLGGVNSALYGFPSAEVFEIGKEAQKDDWGHFFKMSPEELTRLWQYQQDRGKSLKSWHWTWRVGWTRICGKIRMDACGPILEQATQDRALVVRAEAVTVLAGLFRGTANPRIAADLGQMYRSSANSRNGQPLYIQERILWALNELGGSKAKALAASLASGHPKTEKYWAKLSR